MSLYIATILYGVGPSSRSPSKKETWPIQAPNKEEAWRIADSVASSINAVVLNIELSKSGIWSPQ